MLMRKFEIRFSNKRKFIFNSNQITRWNFHWKLQTFS